jgi:hypothetical protein
VYPPHIRKRFLEWQWSMNYVANDFSRYLILEQAMGARTKTFLYILDSTLALCSFIILICKLD